MNVHESLTAAIAALDAADEALTEFVQPFWSKPADEAKPPSQRELHAMRGAISSARAHTLQAFGHSVWLGVTHG